MLIVDYIQDSFQEYQNHWALVLFCFGCNLNCKNCYNYDVVTDKNNIKGTAKELIKKHITPMHDSVVFLGGEPTIWKEKLIDSCRFAKEKKLKTKVYTNGMLPYVIESLNEEQLVDAYSVDLKSVKNVSDTITTKINDEEYLFNFDTTIESIREHNLDLEIRTTKIENVNLEEIKVYLSSKYPDVRHIIQEDFSHNLKNTK